MGFDLVVEPSNKDSVATPTAAAPAAATTTTPTPEIIKHVQEEVKMINDREPVSVIHNHYYGCKLQKKTIVSYSVNY